MKTYEVRNINHIFKEVIPDMAHEGVARPSRLGPVLEFAEPVATVYLQPQERVLFCPERNANPFFHFFEALWMLAGRNDVALLAYFNQRMRGYSDDGKVFHGAYGYRWRFHFGKDQLNFIVKELKADPDSRRAVLQIWDTASDLGANVRDIPCNDMVFFKVRQDALDMTVCNRSNDLIWGAYGANAVHFSMLHEYMAARIGVPMGVYTQISDSLHVYTDNPQWELLKQKYARADLWKGEPCEDNYDILRKVPLFAHSTADDFYFEVVEFMASLEGFVSNRRDDIRSPTDRTLRYTAIPLWWAWIAWKVGDYDHALRNAAACEAEDWGYAAHRWLTRAIDKKEKKDV